MKYFERILRRFAVRINMGETLKTKKCTIEDSNLINLSPKFQSKSKETEEKRRNRFLFLRKRSFKLFLKVRFSSFAFRKKVKISQP